MIRIFLFLITNFAVTVIFGTVLFLTGMQSDSIAGLIVLSILVGFSGSIISLILSKQIARLSFNGHIITQNSRNQFELWIFQTIQRQSKQVNIQPPEIFIYYTPEINAFATGKSKNSALLALSTALLKNMNKKHIEAVIAHEMSHIINGDMVTLSLMQGVVNTFVFFISYLITKVISYIISTQKESIYVKYATVFINLFLSTILQIIFGALASMIVMKYSRYREYRADADATKFVPRKQMISALERFKQIREPSVSHNMSTHYIHGKSKSILNLFSSHPSTQDRIIALYNKTYIYH
ncbi:protease HtpX [Buchnera aphidicola]|uniref:protease HtpX n=1 Tax=Buchnera aphidicola TaxID=9 RepID=UPI003464084C